jgi:YVTN family beta-propeller protein
MGYSLGGEIMKFQKTKIKEWIKLTLTIGAVAGGLAIWQGSDLSFSSAASSAEKAKSGIHRAETTAVAVKLAAARFQTPTNSSPIVVSPDDKYVWVANPDTDSVSVINVEDDANTKVAEIPVGDEPQNLAISPDGKTVYVSNTVDGTVSVISATPGNFRVLGRIRVGTEPYGMAFTPNGTKLYVANARSNNISVIDPGIGRVVNTIGGVGFEPRGLAITNDGDEDDSDEKVYVTQFLGVDRPGVLIGRDDYKEGRVSVISTRLDDVEGEVVLSPQAETGFKSDGSALARIKPGTLVDTGAFPNMLNSVVIKGNRAYLPNNAVSPDGPVRFNVNVQAFLNVIDITTDQEGQAGGKTQSINMNRGVNFEAAGPNKLFFAVPWHAAFKRNSNEGYVVSLSSNILVKVILDQNGTPTINAPLQAGDPGNIRRIKVGQNPRGIAINSTDTRAYVMNEVSRDVSVVNIVTDQLIENVSTAPLPAPGSEEARVLIGKAIFNSSTGVDLPQLGSLGVVGQRLSNEGWSSCFACHAFGLTDGAVWIFGTGPRRSVHLNGSFNPRNASDQKVLNYSAIFDEVQDFENNIRGVSGGLGLIVDGNGNQDPVLNAFNPANTGRSPQLDLLAEYVAKGIRTPISPLANIPPFFREGREVVKGRALFAAMNCQKCHGGEGWSVSRRDYTPPPAATELLAENGANQLFRFLRKVGTFDPNAANEIRQNQVAALGKEGYNPPSLLGAWAMGPLFHNGSAITIDDILNNIEHRRAGLRPFDRDLLIFKKNREALTTFLKSIDASTEPFPIP